MNANENPLLPLPLRILPLKFWRRYRTSTAKYIKTSLWWRTGTRAVLVQAWWVIAAGPRGTGNKKGKKHNLKVFLNILRTLVKIGSHIDGLQEECTSAGGYVKRLNLIWDVVDMLTRQPNQTVIDTYLRSPTLIWVPNWHFCQEWCNEFQLQ